MATPTKPIETQAVDQSTRKRAAQDQSSHDPSAYNQVPPLTGYNLFLSDRTLVKAVERGGAGWAVEQISDFAGLSRTNPLLAFMFAMLLFSLAGIPPLAGFFAKWYVFVAAIKANLFTLAVIGVLSSVVGAYYYLSIVKTMYFDEPAKPFEPMPHELKAVLAATGLFNLLFFVYPSPLVEAADAAAKSLF